MDFINKQLLLPSTNRFYWGLFTNVKAFCLIYKIYVLSRNLRFGGS